MPIHADLVDLNLCAMAVQTGRVSGGEVCPRLVCTGLGAPKDDVWPPGPRAQALAVGLASLPELAQF